LDNWNFNLNQLLNAVLHRSAGPPEAGAAANAGAVYYDTGTNQEYTSNGQSWAGDADECIFFMGVGP
jgi:hypothetical protein